MVFLYLAVPCMKMHIAVCLGCRLHVFQRIFTRFLRGRLSGSPDSFADIQTSTGIGQVMTDGVDRVAIVLANIDLGQIAAVASLTLLGSLPPRDTLVAYNLRTRHGDGFQKENLRVRRSDMQK